MSEVIAGSDPSTEANTGFDASRIAEVKAWLVSQFDAAGKDVPDFEYTPRSIAHLHNLATISQTKTQAAGIVVNDFRHSMNFVAMADISLSKAGVEEKRVKVKKESKVLLDYTRKAIARLPYFKSKPTQCKC